VTPRPALGSVAEELYARLEPFHEWSSDGATFTDEDLGWPLLVYWGLLAKRWQLVDDISRDGDFGPGWTPILDVGESRDEALPWLGQFNGTVMLPGMTPEQMRARILGTDGFQRGTPSAIAVAARRHLTGDQNVIINERLAGDAKRIGVATYTAETPDPDLTRQDIEEQLPWWIKLDYIVEDAWDYAVLRTAFDDYAAVRLHFNATGYLGIRDENPPA
jgi:hypothetical protein